MANDQPSDLSEESREVEVRLVQVFLHTFENRVAGEKGHLPLPLHPLPGPDNEVHGAADERERVAKLVLEIPAIREVQRLVGVREEGDRRRLGAELRGVVEAAPGARKRAGHKAAKPRLPQPCLGRRHGAMHARHT